jgi:hypothetical protein
MSLPLDFGFWRMNNGQRRLLTWWGPENGALTLDGPGGLDVLAIIDNEDDLRRRLAGWEDHCDLRDGLGWVATQLKGCR